MVAYVLTINQTLQVLGALSLGAEWPKDHNDHTLPSYDNVQ
jgi:hypothetical protein